MLKFFLLLKLLSTVCNAQNDIYPQHPDEVLRQVAEPSPAAVARRALRGLSIPEVIKGVYPTLPTAPRSSPAAARSEPSKVEQLPVPESLRQNAEPQTQSQLPPIAVGVRVVQAPPSTSAITSQTKEAQVTPDSRPQRLISSNQAQPLLLGSRETAPPALNIRIVSAPSRTAAARQDVVDLNVLPRNFQSLSQGVQQRRIIASRPAANIRFVPAPTASPPAQLSPVRSRANPERPQAYTEAANQRSDSSDDYYESYEFGYEIRTPEGTHSHEERKIPTGQVFGSYSMALADGRQRLVTYSADKDGFHPVVETNELGTLTSEPADAKIVSSATSSGLEAPAQSVAPTGTSKRIKGIRKTKTKKSST